MKCKVCGAESGKYPLCRACNEKKEKGEIIKCTQCGSWHYKDQPCPVPGAEEESSSRGENVTSEAPAGSTEGSVIPEAPAAPEPAPSPSSMPAQNGNFLYESKTLLTQTEQLFWEGLKTSVPPGYMIFPQINLATFIDKTDDSRFRNELFRNVDFLITDESFRPRIVVEINDQTHLASDRRKRDEKVKNICEEAGIPILTLWASYGVKPDYIQGKIQELLSAPVKRIRHSEDRDTSQKSEKKGCYIATCVYGSYDCPQVWSLRRYRDSCLDSTWYGRLFIKLYYFVSPTLVRLFGQNRTFRFLWKRWLDRKVARLNAAGYSDAPYEDQRY